MPMQYIKDNNSTTTAVVIPVSEWKQIIIKHQALSQLEEGQIVMPEKKMKPSDFAGSLSEEAYQEITEHIKQAQNEWDRDT